MFKAFEVFYNSLFTHTTLVLWY